MIEHLVVAVLALARGAERACFPAGEQRAAVAGEHVRGRQPQEKQPADFAEGGPAGMMNPEGHRLRLFADVGIGHLRSGVRPRGRLPGELAGSAIFAGREVEVLLVLLHESLARQKRPDGSFHRPTA